MEAATVQSTPFTPFQIEMLELVAKVTSEREMTDIRRMLGQYFAKRAEECSYSFVGSRSPAICHVIIRFSGRSTFRLLE